MMPGKPLVFLLHGMGDYSDGWSKPFIAALDGAIQENDYAELVIRQTGGKSIEDSLELVPINYSTYCSALIKSWNDKSKDAIDLASPAMKPKVERAVGWLNASEMQKNSFVWTHLLDVFFWLTNSNIRNLIKNLVADTITDAILARRRKDEFDRFSTSLVSHSLGTAVAHHTIQDIASGAWKSGTNGFSPSWFHFDTMHTIANVSKLLAFDPNYPVYDGFVRPGAYGDPSSYTLYFCDYRHPLDPFCLPAPFSPTDWPVALLDAQEPSHIHQLNVHALEHYAANPVVHIRLLRGWFGYNCISPKEEIAAIKSFKMFKVPEKKRASVQTLASTVAQAVGISPDLVDILKGVALIADSYQKNQ
jgi:hypothetical protein